MGMRPTKDDEHWWPRGGQDNVFNHSLTLNLRVKSSYGVQELYKQWFSSSHSKSSKVLGE